MRDFYKYGKKIVAIGRNFSEHAKELGNKVPDAPMFFLKPTSSYLLQPGKIEIPKGCNVHHEVELGVVIGKLGRDIKASQAEQYIAGYVLALDMTNRTLQQEAQKKGHPWAAAKGADTFTPISEFIARDKIPDPHNVNLWCKVNETMRQNGSTKDMIFRIPQLLEYVSSIMKLEEGDLLLTGTPSGVGPIAHGNKIYAGLRLTPNSDNLVKMEFDCIDRLGTGRWGNGK